MTNDDISNATTAPTVSPAQAHADNQRLWTPWRMRYVGGNATEQGCLFCNRIASDDDVRSLILYRGEHLFVIMNLFPYNTGHVMIVPNTHVATPEHADDATLAAIGQLLRPTLRAQRRALGCDGFNVGFNVGAVAGAGVADHLHQHVVPRWTGDANFMPILASTMVLPELIPATYAKLRAELAREFGAASTSSLVILAEDATRVAVTGRGDLALLPTITAQQDQSLSQAAAHYLAELKIEAVLAGWAGPNRATHDERPALTFVTPSLKGAVSDLRFMAIDGARIHFTKNHDRDTLDLAIRQLAPGIR
jgi:ATP adenylyltransferase